MKRLMIAMENKEPEGAVDSIFHEKRHQTICSIFADITLTLYFAALSLSSEVCNNHLQLFQSDLWWHEKHWWYKLDKFIKVAKGDDRKVQYHQANNWSQTSIWSTFIHISNLIKYQCWNDQIYYDSTAPWGQWGPFLGCRRLVKS